MTKTAMKSINEYLDELLADNDEYEWDGIDNSVYMIDEIPPSPDELRGDIPREDVYTRTQIYYETTNSDGSVVYSPTRSTAYTP